MKKSNKIIALLMALLTAVCALASCGGAGETKETEKAPEQSAEVTAAETEAPETEAPADLSKEIRVYTLAGPTGMGMAKMISDKKNGKSELNCTFNVATAPDQVTAEVVKGEYEIAAVPVNLASVLYNKTEGALKVAAVNTLGVLYVLENGETVKSVSDLKGQTIYATGQGSTPEYTLRYILEKNGIDPDKDVTVEYLSEHAELATKMTSGDVKLGMLPEPNVTAVTNGNKDVRVALDLTEEWNKVAPSDLVQGVVIVNKKFAEENPALLAKFLEEYNDSVAFANENVDEVSVMIEEAGIIPKAAVAKKALPNCNIVFLEGEQMKAAVSGMLEVLFAAKPQSVGGKLPDDAFYYLGK